MNSCYTLITGGTTGIGYDVAESLIKQGKPVIITGQNQQRVSQAARALDCLGLVADSANISSLNELGKHLLNEGIRLDGLVLNAGIFAPEPLVEITEDSYDLTMATNTKGPYFTLKALLPLLQNPSSVVFVSSIVVEKVFAASSAYTASKAAMEALLRVANIELAPRGIRINSIRPGITKTAIQGKAGMNDKERETLFASMNVKPLGRALEPSDHTGAITFLLSEASIAMRNAVLTIDGGYSL